MTCNVCVDGTSRSVVRSKLDVKELYICHMSLQLQFVHHFLP